MAVSLTDGYFTGPYKNALDKGNAAEKTGEDSEKKKKKKKMKVLSAVTICQSDGHDRFTIVR